MFMCIRDRLWEYCEMILRVVEKKIIQFYLYRAIFHGVLIFDVLKGVVLRFSLISHHQMSV